MICIGFIINKLYISKYKTENQPKTNQNEFTKNRPSSRSRFFMGYLQVFKRNKDVKPEVRLNKRLKP